MVSCLTIPYLGSSYYFNWGGNGVKKLLSYVSVLHFDLSASRSHRGSDRSELYAVHQEHKCACSPKLEIFLDTTIMFVLLLQNVNELLCLRNRNDFFYREAWFPEVPKHQHCVLIKQLIMSFADLSVPLWVFFCCFSYCEQQGFNICCITTINRSEGKKNKKEWKRSI